MFASSPKPFFVLMAISLHLFTFQIVSTTETPPLLVVRLVHHNSVYSPYYNTSSLIPTANIHSPLKPRVPSGFLARLEVGRQHVEQWVYMDTGSSLLWIFCEVSDDNVPTRVPKPIYDPRKSSTFTIEHCKYSSYCGATGVVKSWCDQKDRCKYDQRYGGGKMDSGILGRERFWFGNNDEILRYISFGCAINTNLYANGVLGLGADDISLVSQLSAVRFSHCFGNLSDESYKYNSLVIGNQIRLEGARTPLIIDGKYYITLKGINFGGDLLEIDPQIFRRITSDHTGGMLVDTGSTFSYLPRIAITKLEQEIIEEIDDFLPRNYSVFHKGDLSRYNRLCYNGLVNYHLIGFPKLQFVFENYAVLKLTVENYFQQYSDNTFCLSIMPSEIQGFEFSLLGNLMMQYHYIAYDIAARQLSMFQMDCYIIDEYINQL